MGNSETEHVVLVRYSTNRGVHMFVAREHGLYIANRDLRSAFDAVATLLGYLLSDDEGRPVVCEPEESYEEFVGRLERRTSPPEETLAAAVAQWKMSQIGGTLRQ